MSWRRTIIEYMTKMGSAAGASYLITRHPMTGIGSYGYFVSGQRCIETWPPGAGLKFGIGAEQLIPARAAEINSFFVIVPIQILVRQLCVCFAQNLKLSGSQNLSPFIITQCYLLRHRGGLDLASESSRFSVFCDADTDRQDAEQKQV
jgi:hypothetical protein